jgi:glycine hydroxymethyltransferase
MPHLSPRSWVTADCESLIQRYANQTAAADSTAIAARLDALVEDNRQIHERDCFNLNPATNVMNPRAEAMLASGIGSRPSLGYPGDKYEMGLEAIEEIEVIAAELAAEVFNARYAEIRVPSGAIANLYGFMALTKPGDAIIAPPASIGGHVTHHDAGCAGLYGLQIHHAPVAADGYTVDVDALANLAREVKPKLITIGGSLNLQPHPVAAIRAIADEVGAHVLFDAAHQCGIIAGGAWPNPLDEGAHLMTMSTYKSLGGPAGGLIVTNDAGIAEKLDHIAFPGMTANFDAAKSAALAVSLLDWREHGQAYAAAMVELSKAHWLPRWTQKACPSSARPTASPNRTSSPSRPRASAVGRRRPRTLRKAGFLACGIGLPIDLVNGDMNGLRIGTPELVRWGLTPADAPRMAQLIARALTTNDPATLAQDVGNWRKSFDKLHFIRA